MMNILRPYFLALAILLIAAGIAMAQDDFGGGPGQWGGFGGGGRSRFRGGGGGGPIYRTEGGQLVNIDTVTTARETLPMVTEMANWTNTFGFDQDVFTYARIIFESDGWHDSRGWVNDYPDADLNFSFRLQELTSLKAHPDGRVLKITDPKLADYPVIFASQPGRMMLTEEEVRILRNYVLNGGVLVGDDIWGAADWSWFAEQMKRILPEGKWTDLTMDHPLFHSVFNFKGPMNRLQVPSIHFWQRISGQDPATAHVSRYRGPGSEDMHVRAWLDKKGHVMILGLNNTDTGDGFEREGEEEDFFHEISEPRAYPFGINLVFYLMSH